MEDLYLQSLYMICVLNLKNTNEYKIVSKKHHLLAIPTLKFMVGTKNFNDVIEYANKKYSV